VKPLMPFGFWLVTIAAVAALLTPDRGTVATVLLAIMIVCGTASSVLAQRQQRASELPCRKG
jgi:hypothetical protein